MPRDRAIFGVPVTGAFRRRSFWNTLSRLQKRGIPIVHLRCTGRAGGCGAGRRRSRGSAAGGGGPIKNRFPPPVQSKGEGHWVAYSNNCNQQNSIILLFDQLCDFDYAFFFIIVRFLKIREKTRKNRVL